MIAHLNKVWESRSPRDRKIIAILAGVVCAMLYLLLVQSGGAAHTRLSASVTTLRAQVSRIELQAAELGRLRAAPSTPPSQTDLRALVEAQAGAAGLSRALVKIEAPDANQVVVVFSAVAFEDWLGWVVRLKAQQVRLDTCRIEALSTPGMIGVTATLLRAKQQ
jgi:general secretion pathway protein M